MRIFAKEGSSAGVVLDDGFGIDAAEIRIVPGVECRHFTTSAGKEISKAAGADAVLAGTNRLAGKAVETIFQGESSEHILSVAGQRIRMVRTPPLLGAPSDMTVEFDAADVVVLTE